MLAATAPRAAFAPALVTAPIAAQPPPPPPDPAAGVPEIVVDRRVDTEGNVTSLRTYQRGRLLGKGGFARCFKFLNREKNRSVAGKVVDKETLNKARAKSKLLAEIKIHRSVSHKYIVGFESFFEDTVNVYMMLEVCPNQTLMELVKRRRRLTEGEAAHFSLQLIDAMRYLHANAIIHRDLKLGNLFLSGDVGIRVGDFGLATMVTERGERKRTVCGTPNYIAPEILDGGPHGGHSFEVDIWAFGVILFTLVVGKPPFETADVKSTYKRIRENSYAFPSDIPLSPDVKDLISRILVPSPGDRPSLDAIAMHPFFTAPHVLIPTALPLTALAGVPTFTPDKLQPGATMVRAILSKPPMGLLVRDASGQRKQASSPALLPAPSTIPAPAAAIAAPAAAPAAASAAPPLPTTTSRPALAFIPAANIQPTPLPLGSKALAVATSAAAPSSHQPSSAAFYPQQQQQYPLHAHGLEQDDGASSAGGVTPWEDAPISSSRPTTASSSSAPTSAVATAAAAAGTSLDGGFARMSIRDGSGVGGGAGSSKQGQVQQQQQYGGSSVAGGGGGYDKENEAGRGGGKMGVHSRPLSTLQLSGSTSSSSSSSSNSGLSEGGGGMGGGVSPNPNDMALYGSSTKTSTTTGSTASTGSSGGGPPTLTHTPWLTSLNSAVAAVATSVASGVRGVTGMSGSSGGGGGGGGSVAVFTGNASGFAAPTSSAPASFSPRALDGTARGFPIGATVARANPAAMPPPMVAPPAVPPPSAQQQQQQQQATTTTTPALFPVAPSSSLNDTLRTLYNSLSHSISQHHSPTTSLRALTPARLATRPPLGLTYQGCSVTGEPPPPYWVTTWIDYSAKYGLGYLLSNGSVGVYFNDSTKIILECPGVGGERFQYLERQSTAPGSVPYTCTIPGAVTLAGEDGLVRVVASLTTYPPELKKKVTLLRHFRDFLVAQYAKRAAGGGDSATATAATGAAATPGSGSSLFAASVASAGGGSALCTVSVPVSEEEMYAMVEGGAGSGVGTGSATTTSLPLVKKWVRSRRAVLFRLSDGAGVQVSFYDGWSLIFSPEGGARVTVLDPLGRRNVFSTPAFLAAAATGAAAAAGLPAAATSSTTTTTATLPSSVGLWGVNSMHAALTASGVSSKEKMEDLAARIKYAKDILHQVVVVAGSGGVGGVGAQPANSPTS